jgi:hypothetical protein
MDCGLDDPSFCFWKAKQVSLFPQASRLAVGHLTSCSVGTRGFSARVDGWGVKVTTHFHLVPRVKMSGIINVSSYMSS